MLIKKSQAVLKCFIDFKYIAFGLRWAQKTKPCFVTRRTVSTKPGLGHESDHWTG